MSSRVRVFAPATVANLGPGYDVAGLALTSPGDILDAELSAGPGVELVEITGQTDGLGQDSQQNVATIAAQHALRQVVNQVAARSSGTGGVPGVRLRLRKGVPLAGGLGSSAASSVAGAFAVNELFGGALSAEDVLRAALEGERAACGAAHADNAAPGLVGGIVLVRSYEPLEIISLPVPRELCVAVVHPHCTVETATARVLVQQRRFAASEAVPNLGNLGAFVHALHTGDLALLGRCVADRLVEPIRAPLIPGFEEVRTAARADGALGCSIAGSGPSVFALCEGAEAAERVARGMARAFQQAAGLDADVFYGEVNTRGAQRID